MTVSTVCFVFSKHHAVGKVAQCLPTCLPIKVKTHHQTQRCDNSSAPQVLTAFDGDAIVKSHFSK